MTAAAQHARQPREAPGPAARELQLLPVAPATVDVPDLATELGRRDRPLVLDVRTPEEYRVRHLEGAVLVPLEDVWAGRERLAGALTGDVVVVCRTGTRARSAAIALADTSARLRLLRGGVTAWVAAGQPVVRGVVRWELERRVRLVAGTLVLLGLAVGLVVPAARLLSTFVGAGLVVAAVTDTCLLGTLLARRSRPSGSPEPASLLAGLAAPDR